MTKTSRFIIIAGILFFTGYCLYPTIDYYYLVDDSFREAFEKGKTMSGNLSKLNKKNEKESAGEKEDITQREDYQEVMARLKFNQNRIIRPGLDLKGGLSIVLRANFDKLKEIKKGNIELDGGERSRILDQVMKKIRDRIDVAGVSEITMRKDGDDRIVVQIPGEMNSDRIEKIISTTGKLEFKKVSSEEMNKLNQFLEKNPNKNIDFTELKERVQKKGMDVAFLVSRNSGLGVSIPNSAMVLENKVYLEGDMLQNAQVVYGDLGEPEVLFTLDSEGARIFGDLTTNSVNEKIAILLDGVIVSAPVVKQPILNGQATISGSSTLDEVRDLANILRAGSLPIPVEVISKDIIGAKLGADLRHRAINALIFAMSIVVLFMLFYYRLAGLVACLGLSLNALMVVAFLSSFGLSLSLSGIAGLLLTVGMSIDANVIIFERIKEEYKAQPRGFFADFIRHGYSRAFWSIFDANVTTLMAAFVLFYYGSGSLQGFATTLFMGIIVSMVTSLFFTRYLFDLMIDGGLIKRYNRLII